MAARRVFTLTGAMRAFSTFDRHLQDAIVQGGNEGLAVMLRLITNSPVMRRASTARDDSGYIQRPSAPGGALSIRTGSLAASVSYEPFFRKGNEFRGGHFTVGVKYGMIHERGGVVQHPGSTKYQRFVWQGSLRHTHYTRPHAIRIPARPFIRPGALRGLPTMASLIKRRMELAADNHLGLA